jgi:hypothetical protein
MPSVGFKPMITASEREKTVHALDRSDTVTGILIKYHTKIYIKINNIQQMEKRKEILQRIN